MPEVKPCTRGSAADALLGCDALKKALDEAALLQEGFPLKPKFPTTTEVENIYNLTKGYSRQFFPIVPYKRLLTEARELDDIHGEIAEPQKRWATRIGVRAFVVPSVITQPLTKLGIEDVRTAELQITVPDLVSAGLATQDPDTYEVTMASGIGDHFWYHFKEYEIDTCVPSAWWGNTDIALYFQMKAHLYQPQSVDVVGP